MSSFPDETRKWKSEHIQKVKEVLPDDISFCSLTGAGPEGFKLYTHKTIDFEDVQPMAEDIKKRLGEIGLEVVSLQIGAGTCGTISSVPQIYVRYDV